MFLLRHGETEWNVAGRLQGRDDSPLTARGLAQARDAATALAREGVTRIYTSPLGRARATAAHVAAASGAGITEVAALAEIDFGEASGLTLAAAEERFPGLAAARADDRWGYRWPGGESYADAGARLAGWLATAPEGVWADDALVVSHQSLLRAWLHVAGGSTPEHALAQPFESGSAWRWSRDGALEGLLTRR